MRAILCWQLVLLGRGLLSCGTLRLSLRIVCTPTRLVKGRPPWLGSFARFATRWARGAESGALGAITRPADTPQSDVILRQEPVQVQPEPRVQPTRDTVEAGATAQRRFGPIARAEKKSLGLILKHLLCPLNPLTQPILEHGVLLPSPNMVRDRLPNHFGDGLFVDRRNGLEFGRLFGGQPDRHGLHLLHTDIMA